MNIDFVTNMAEKKNKNNLYHGHEKNTILWSVKEFCLVNYPPLRSIYLEAGG